MSQTAQPAAANPIDTKAAARRSLKFDSFEEIATDLDRIEAAMRQ